MTPHESARAYRKVLGAPGPISFYGMLVGMSALLVPPPRQPGRPYAIQVVCAGNICRSPMGEVVLRERLLHGAEGSFVVDSSGTGGWHEGEPADRRARLALEREGYDGTAHRARQFRPAWFRQLDLVLAMDRANLADLRRLAPRDFLEQDRLRLFGAYGEIGPVPDPYLGTLDDFLDALAMIEEASDSFVEEWKATPRMD